MLVTRGDRARRKWKWTPELLATIGIAVVALIVALITVWHPAGWWAYIVQFAMGGWPDEVERASKGVLFLGVLLQTFFTFGLPIILVTIIYRRLTRRDTMRIATYISHRDKVIEARVYAALRAVLRANAPDVEALEELNDLDKQAWEMATAAMQQARHVWDQQLSAETLDSLAEDRVRVAGEQPEFARLKQ